jgi:hypothetical protein
MCNPSKTIAIYRSQRSSAELFICEWQSVGAGVHNGLFFVEAGHLLDAKQTAKRALRDDLAKDCEFSFTIRAPILLERPLALIATPRELPPARQFADSKSAPSKT